MQRQRRTSPGRTKIIGAAGLTGLALLAAVFAESPRAEEKPVVAAAASVQFALEEISRRFLEKTGHSVRLSFGSSGNLARQIRQGAPYQVFLSADERYALELSRDGFTDGDGALYAVGRLVLVVPHGSSLEADGSLNDLRAALFDGRLDKFAIANPEHAPYGRRAEEALRSAGLWEHIRRRLVLGENVAQAAQFAISGNAQGGLIAESLAQLPRVRDRASTVLVSEDLHRPLRQRAVLIKGAGKVARRYFEFLSQSAARAEFRRYGFALPEPAN